MELAIELINSNEISTQDKVEIDKFIENMIEVHKSNSSEINKLVMDSVTALTVSEARSNELASQGFIKRGLKNLTGKNQKIRADIDRNLVKSQYASQQMIQKLAEQNLLTFDTITAVNNKLNTLAIEMDEEINKVYKTLIVYFKQTKSDLIQMETRMDKLERNVNLLQWNTTIEYQMYDGIEYCDLPNIEKIVCIANDFYHLTKGIWNTSDIMLLKTTLSEIGLNVKSKISSGQFFEYLIEKPTLIDRMLKDISLEGMMDVEIYHIPLLKGVEKLSKLQGEEKYLYDTVVSQLELVNVDYNKRDIKISMIHNYLINTAYINTDLSVNIFDFVVELLVNYKMIESTMNIQEIAATNEMKEDIQIVEEDLEIEVGDYVQYGRYKNKPIIWKIINENYNSYMILSTYCLLRKEYSYLKRWLNDTDDFLNEFTREEINFALGKEYTGSKFGFLPSISWKDLKVFLLSVDEIENLLIKKDYTSIAIIKAKNENKPCGYWLRDSAGSMLQYKVTPTGDFGHAKMGDRCYQGVRPAMYIGKLEILSGEGTIEKPYVLFQ